MDIFQLRVFRSLAHTLNYRKAAEENHITQPAVSYHIRTLEKELMVQLFEHNKYKTSLTEAGLEFLQYAEVICEQEYLAKERMKSLAQGESGRITIASIQSFLMQISPVIASFSKDNPDVRIDTYMLDGPDLLRSHSFGEYDIYFCAENMVSANSDYRSIKAESAYMELYYPAELERRIRKEDWSELSGLTYISIIESNHLLYERVHRIMDSIGFHPGKINHASSIESILYFVDSGCGVSILPAKYNEEGKYANIHSMPIIQDDALLSMILSVNTRRNTILTGRFFEKSGFDMNG